MTRRDSSRSARASSSAGLVAGAHEAAVAAERRQFVRQRARQLGGERGIGPAQRRDGLRKLARQLAERREPRGKFACGKDAVADGGEVARAAAADDNARQRAGEIGRRFQAVAQVVP